jgi:metal-responsive CopG/Arc/MetJ family transcriptional regulator
MPNKPPVNTEHTSIRLPSELVKGADAVAERYGLGRSTVIRVALAEYVSKRRPS